MSNIIDVLFTGYSYDDEDDKDCMRANCSCTLIRTGDNGLNIIVDTMTAWDGEKILDALKKKNLTADDISIVVNTHGHSDHTGCNYLFRQAQIHILGSFYSYHDKYYDRTNVGNTVYKSGGVTVLKTPGHTLSCVSVLVEDTQYGCTAICGDLFEKEEDILNESIWINAGSENIKDQKLNRLKISSMCNYLIPGHGPGFTVTEQMRLKLKQDITKEIKMQ